MSDIASAERRDADISSLIASVNDAASRAATYWISFLTFMAYLTMTVGAVTHEMLLKASPIKLPLLNVELPLVGFFVIAPIFFLLFHFYLFLTISMVIRKAFALQRVLEGQFPDDPAAQDLQRQRLDTFMVLQHICGPSDARSGTTGRLLRFVTLITLILVPIILLIQIQLTFLPYHHTWVTWVHRIAVLVDLRFAWIFWRSISTGEGQIVVPESHLTWHKLRHPFAPMKLAYRKNQFGLLASLIVFFASFVAISHKGEWVGRIPVGVDGMTVSDIFLHGRIDMVAGRPRTWFSNVLVVPHAKIIPDNDWKPNSNYPTLSLRGRDLRGAVLIGSDLRGVDFTGANLNDARLDRAVLTRARFGCSSLQERPNLLNWPEDECTWMQRASFFRAEMQEVELTNTRAQGAILLSSNLQGANMEGTLLEGAVLIEAQLQGARLTGVELSNTNLSSAKLVGAHIKATRFDGALIDDTLFDLAYIEDSLLEGSRGVPGHPEGHGTLDSRVDLPPEYKHRTSGFYLAQIDGQYKRKADLKSFDRESAKRIRGEILELLRPDDQAKYIRIVDRSTGEPETKWNVVKDVKTSDESDEQYRLNRNNYIEQVLCGANSAPYVTRGIIENEVIKLIVLPLQVDWLVKLLNPNECPGAKELQPIHVQLLDGALRSAKFTHAAKPQATVLKIQRQKVR